MLIHMHTRRMHWHMQSPNIAGSALQLSPVDTKGIVFPLSERRDAGCERRHAYESMTIFKCKCTGQAEELWVVSPLEEPEIRRLTREACGRSVRISNCSSFA